MGTHTLPLLPFQSFTGVYKLYKEHTQPPELPWQISLSTRRMHGFFLFGPVLFG